MHHLLDDMERSRFERMEKRARGALEMEEPDPEEESSAERQSIMTPPQRGDRDPDVSTDEFARLSVIMRDGERARAALNTAVGMELSWEQLDARMTRDSFWGIVKRDLIKPP